MEDKFNPFQNSLDKKEEYNSWLIDQAIIAINEVLGELIPANVSRMTKKIDPKHKGITPSGISKNDKHRTKINIAILDREKNIKKLSPKDIENLEMAEMHGQLFSCRCPHASTWPPVRINTWPAKKVKNILALV